MKTYKFNIDLFFCTPEPENWYDTLDVPLSDNEVEILINAYIDQKFILPSLPDADTSGDNYLIIERTSEVYKRIINLMVEVAEERGWKDCIPQCENSVNIWFTNDLKKLAQETPRWKEYCNNNDGR